MPTIFITIPWFTPAYKAGGPIRSIHNLVAALNDSFRFYIFTSYTDVDNIMLPVETNKWLDFMPNVKVWYDNNLQRSKNLTEEAEKIKPDIIYINGIYSWFFNLVPLIFVKAPKKSVAVRGTMHPNAVAEKSWKKKPYLKLLKWWGTSKEIHWQATDEQEATYIRKYLGNNAAVAIVKNLHSQIKNTKAENKIHGSLKLLSVGLISPMKNYHSVLNALKNITGKVEYTIVGAIKDTAYWKQCLQIIEQLPENITIKYLGPQPFNEIQEHLAQNNVFVLPSKSENFGHAILEALGCGLPVITSKNVPWRNLSENKAGSNCAEKDLDKQIQAFIDMDEATFRKYRDGALNYAAKNSENFETIQGYKKLFSKP